MACFTTQRLDQSVKFKLECAGASTDDFKIYGATIVDAGDLTFPADSETREILNTAFEACGKVAVNSCVVENCNFISSDETAAELPSGNVHKLKNSNFINNVNGVEIPNMGTYTFDGLVFTGNTNDIKNSSTGLVTANASGISNVSTYTNTNGGTTVINNTKQFTFFVKDTSGNNVTGYEWRLYEKVLEANLAFSDGMTICMMSEFLSYTEGDTGNNKQDCELKAFYRLAARLKKAFPALKIMLLLDGLYAKGPVVEVCRQNKWQFMIVLKDDALPSVMGEFEALAALEPKNRHSHQWGNRNQMFRWVNDIDYRFGSNEKKKQILHVVECVETWKEIDKQSADPVEKSSRHVWLSSETLNRWCLHERCNLAARSRWGIETNILVEKHHGYSYEHCFSYNWNTMKGYHYLMRLGHLFNAIARYCQRLAKMVKDTGVRGLIRFIRETIAHPWLDYEWLIQRLNAPFQLRLV
jgi:hypothetical protein